MKIFVCEYITGGGLYSEHLPASLVEEGSLMRDAVLSDIGQLPDITTISTYDARLSAPLHTDTAIPVNSDPWKLWQNCIAQADAVLPIAPESGNVLLRLTQLVSGQTKLLLGSSVGGVSLAASKLGTCKALQAANIDTVPTWPVADFPAEHFEQCVIKPDDGAGCEGARFFFSAEDLRTWLTMASATGYVAQPYTHGIPASISMLCRDGQAWLLSCNRQKISTESGQFSYAGSVVNGAAHHWEAFERLGKDIARAMPALAGYIGVDVIVHEHGISVLEINPRLTTSYAGLHQSLGCNPARLLLDLLYNSRFSSVGFQMPASMQRNEVEITLHG